MRWVVLSLSLGLMGFTLWVREWAAEEEPLAAVELPAVVAEPLDVRDAGAAPHFDLDDPYCDPIAVSGGWSFGVDEERRVVTVENGRLSMDPWAVRLPGDWIAAMATALKTRDVAQQRRLLERAQRLVPRDPTTALVMALISRRDPQPDLAIASLDTVLRSVTSKDIERLRSRLRVQRDIQQGFRSFEGEFLSLQWAPNTMDEDAVKILHAVIRDTRWEVAERLSLGGDGEVLSVVVYPTRSELLAVSCAPDWVGGLFDGSIRLTAEDGVPLTAARHETAHAVLNGRIHQRWLSEGLATWFERDPWRYEKIWRAMINQRRWLPPGDLDDALVSSNAVVSRMAYAESLALVMLLERCRGRPGDLEFVRPLVQQGLDVVFKAECRRELTRESFLAGLEQLL